MPNIITSEVKARITLAQLDAQIKALEAQRKELVEAEPPSEEEFNTWVELLYQGNFSTEKIKIADKIHKEYNRLKEIEWMYEDTSR